MFVEDKTISFFFQGLASDDEMCDMYMMYWVQGTQWNGDCSKKKKICKEFCQFRLIPHIKIYYIPDFENVWSRE